MKVNRTALSAALRELARLAPSKPSIPILSHVLVHAENGTATLTATDLTQRLSVELPAEGEINTCLPAKTLAALVKPESKNDTSVCVVDVEGGVANVVLDDITTRLPALVPDDFPSSTEAAGLSLVALWPARELSQALAYVLPAVSDDLTRPHLCGVCLVDGRAASTDGHRLHVAALPSAIAESSYLPIGAAASLARLLDRDGHVVLARTGDLLRVRCDNWTLDTKLKVEVFPPIDQVVPAVISMPTWVEVESKLLVKALGRLAKITSQRLVKMTVNGAITLSTSDPELGDAETAIPVVSSNHTGADFVAGFNSGYLVDAMNGVSGTAQLHLGGCLDPLRVDSDGGRIAIVMPARI